MHRGCLHDVALVSHLCPTCRAPVAANTQRVRRTVDGRIESSAQHRHGVVVEVRHTVVAAPVTQWAPMPAAMLTIASGPRVDTLTQWLARNPNAHREGGPGGASNLLVPLVHHALRANGVALPSEVMLAASMGGRVALRAAPSLWLPPWSRPSWWLASHQAHLHAAAPRAHHWASTSANSTFTLS